MSILESAPQLNAKPDLHQPLSQQNLMNMKED